MPLNDTARSIPTKRLERSASAPTWDVYLDGALVASEIGSEEAARLELDMVAWCAMVGEATLTPGLLVTDEALDLALSIFDQLFLTPKVREKARTALHTIIRPEIYTINRDGSLSVMASSARGRKGAQRSYAVIALMFPRDHDADGALDTDAYQVTMMCECMDYRTRAHEHGGCCKHVAARLLLYLAQQGVGSLKHLRDALADHERALTSAADAPGDPTEPSAFSAPGDALAFLEIGGMQLSAALFLALYTRQPVILGVADGTLQITAGGLSLTLPCADGGGHAAVVVDSPEVARLYDQLRPVAKQIATLSLFIDPADRTVVLCGSDADLSITVQGKAIVAACAPPDA